MSKMSRQATSGVLAVSGTLRHVSFFGKLLPGSRVPLFFVYGNGMFGFANSAVLFPFNRDGMDPDLLYFHRY
jgi:hypothetical protein